MKLNPYFHAYVKLKLYWGWSLGQLNLPLQAFQTYMMLALLLDKYNIGDRWTPVLFVGGALVLITVAGWWGVEYGWYARENSMVNQHNPELLQAAGKNK